MTVRKETSKKRKLQRKKKYCTRKNNSKKRKSQKENSKEEKSRKERFTEMKSERKGTEGFQCLVTLECHLSSGQGQYLATPESHFFIVGILLLVAGPYS